MWPSLFIFLCNKSVVNKISIRIYAGCLRSHFFRNINANSGTLNEILTLTIFKRADL